jgi:hypothetical protein
VTAQAPWPVLLLTKPSYCAVVSQKRDGARLTTQARAIPEQKVGARAPWPLSASACYLADMSDAMNAPSMKDKIVETVQSLPANATVEDAIERILFLAKIERGLREADGEDTIPHSEMKKRFAR